MVISGAEKSLKAIIDTYLQVKSGRGVSPCKGVFSDRSGSGVSDKNTSCRSN